MPCLEGAAYVEEPTMLTRLVHHPAALLSRGLARAFCNWPGRPQGCVRALSAAQACEQRVGRLRVAVGSRHGSLTAIVAWAAPVTQTLQPCQERVGRGRVPRGEPGHGSRDIDTRVALLKTGSNACLVKCLGRLVSVEEQADHPLVPDVRPRGVPQDAVRDVGVVAPPGHA